MKHRPLFLFALVFPLTIYAPLQTFKKRTCKCLLRSWQAMNHYIPFDPDVWADQYKLREAIRSRFFLSRENNDLWEFKLCLQDENAGITIIEFWPYEK